MTTIADFLVNVKLKGDVDELKKLLELKREMSRYTRLEIQKSKERTQLAKVAEAKEKTHAIEVKKDQKEKTKSLTLENSLLHQIFGKHTGVAKVLLSNKKVASGITTSMESFTGFLNSGLGGALALATGFLLVGQQITKATIELAKMNQVYTNFTRQTGLSIGKPLGVAGAMANIDVSMTPEDIMQNMQQLQNNLVGLQFGMGNVAPYQIMGVQAWGQSADVMMDVLRKRLRAFAPEMRTFLLQQMGLDARLGALADLSDKDYLRYKQESLELYLSPEDRKQLQSISADWNKVALKWGKLFDRGVLIMARQFAGLGDVLGQLASILMRIMQLTEMYITPILDILRALAEPLILITDDIMTALLGGDSLIGDLFKGKVDFKDLIKTYFIPSEKNILSPTIDSGLIDTAKGFLQPVPIASNSPNTVMNRFDVSVNANTIADAEGIYNSIKPIFVQTANQIANGVVV